MIKNYKNPNLFNVVIIGGGPAGIGVAIALKEFGVKNTIILEKGAAAESFTRWTKQTRFLSPSFTAHQFNLLDLNAITYDTSPGYSYGKEHPTGKDYATYLQDCIKHFKINIQTEQEVIDIKKKGDGFLCSTKEGGTYESRFLVSAIGEFSFPQENSFYGSSLCRHTGKISSYADIPGDETFIIGGYESGIDAAINLTLLGKKVTILDSDAPWDTQDSDPSNTLSPYTRERLENVKEKITFLPREKVSSVSKSDDEYHIVTDKNKYSTKERPLNGSGFVSNPSLIKDLFRTDAKGFLELNEYDESIITKNLFLVGPKVKHQNVLFCFIYKFRMRFGVVAQQVASRLGIPTEESIRFYKDKNMYLDDLSCCDTECVC